MFSRRSGRISICLRCQSRALFGVRQSPQSRSDTHRCRFHTWNPRLEQDVKVPEDRSHNVSGLKPFRSRYKFKSVYVRGKIRGKKGREVREDTAALPVRTLGQPAEVIILRDAPVEQEQDEETPPSVESSKTDSQLSRQEIVASLRSVDPSSLKTKVEEQIQKLRPPSSGNEYIGSLLPRQDFDKLRKALTDGFTVQQLRAFLKRNLPNAQPSVGSDQDRSFVAWRPGTSSIDTELPERVRREISRYKIPVKHKVVLRILEDLWHIDTIEDVNTIGELEVHVSWNQLALFLANGSSRLHEIASRNRVRLEVRPSGNRIRITAAKGPALDALRDIQNLCKSVIIENRSQSGFYSHLRPKHRSALNWDEKRHVLKEEDATTVASLTNTVIELDTNRTAMKLKIIAANNDDLEEAYRLLKIICSMIPESQSKILQVPTNLENIDRLPSVAAESLPQHLQTHGFLRRQAAVWRYNELAETNGTTDDRSLVESPIMTLTNSSENAVLDDVQLPLHNSLRIGLDTHQNQASTKYGQDTRASLWEQPFQHVTSAAVGHALFPTPPKIRKPLSKRRMAAIESTRPGTTESPEPEPMPREAWFADGIPGLQDLLSSLQQNSKEPQSTQSSLVFRLVPYRRHLEIPPELKLKLADAMPDIFVEFPVGSSYDAYSNERQPTVTAVLRQKSAILMLPQLPVDLKFTRSMIQMQQVKEEPVLGAEFHDWVKNTEEIITRPGPVRPHAPLANVAINPRAMFAMGLSLGRQTLQALSKMPDLVAPYFFTTVEHRQSIPMSFEGYPLILTSKEGGTFGGRGFELKLSIPPSLAGALDERRGEQEAFSRTAYRLACTVDDAVQGKLSKKRKTTELREQPRTPDAADAASPESSTTEIPTPITNSDTPTAEVFEDAEQEVSVPRAATA